MPLRLITKQPSKNSRLHGQTLRYARNAGMVFISLLLMAGAIYPSTVRAEGSLFSQGVGLFGHIFSGLKQSGKGKEVKGSSQPNLQTMSLPRAAMNIDPSSARGGGDVIIDDGSVVAQEGPAGAGADVVYPKNSTISIYVVREGDTVSEIASMFDVSVNTVMWANNITRSTALKVGQQLVILPITSVRHVVKKGDTVASIAKKYHADAAEITQYNELTSETLAVGDEIIVPNGEIAVSAPTPRAKSVATQGGSSSSSYAGYYLRPIAGGTRTQGIHGYNGVDLAAPVGTPILAAADGEVIISRQGGWNGGYGNYIVVKHGNGTQTLYAHNSSNIVGIGQNVVKGQVIGYVGSTGRSTGAHVHFEIRGGPRNPF